jgi:hypothetical protein
MKVIHIEQLDDGVQKKPYADHIFHWHLVVEEADKDDLLTFCRGNLKDAKREHDDYFKQYRQKDIDFDSMMKIVCGGWYQLRDNNDGTFDYIVHYEYID